ncbi:MAG: hypothetical protein M3362_24845, partial [Acidobacteriota bacterium]|nr:hypothetical protein [Acidobacteriota bacterium]
ALTSWALNQPAPRGIPPRLNGENNRTPAHSEEVNSRTAHGLQLSPEKSRSVLRGCSGLRENVG